MNNTREPTKSRRRRQAAADAEAIYAFAVANPGWHRPRELRTGAGVRDNIRLHHALRALTRELRMAVIHSEDEDDPHMLFIAVPEEHRADFSALLTNIRETTRGRIVSWVSGLDA